MTCIAVGWRGGGGGGGNKLLDKKNTSDLHKFHILKFSWSLWLLHLDNVSNNLSFVFFFCNTGRKGTLLQADNLWLWAV